MDRRRRVRAGHRRADHLARRPVERRPSRGRSSPRPRSPSPSSRSPPRTRPRRCRPPGLVEGQPDRRRLGVGVGRPGQGPIVGPDVEAHRHPDRDLALVVALVGVQLRPGRIADHPQPVGDRAADRRAGTRSGRSCPARSARGRGRRAGTPARPRAGSRGPRRSSHRRGRSRPRRPSRRRPRAPTAPDPEPDRRRRRGGAAGRPTSAVARVLGRHQAVAGLDDRRRDPEPGVDLGELAAGRTAAEDDAGSAAARGRVSPRGSSRPGCRPGPRIGGTFEDEPTATITFRPAISWVRSSWRISTRPRPTIRALPRKQTAPASSSRLTCDVSSGSAASAGAVDHVVAARRRHDPRSRSPGSRRARRRRAGATSTAGSRCTGSCRRTTAGR